MFPDELIKACGRWSGFMPSRVGRLRRPSLMNERTASKGETSLHWKSIVAIQISHEPKNACEAQVRYQKSEVRMTLASMMSSLQGNSYLLESVVKKIINEASLCKYIQTCCTHGTAFACPVYAFTLLQMFASEDSLNPPHPLCLLVLSFPLCVD